MRVGSAGELRCGRTRVDEGAGGVHPLGDRVGLLGDVALGQERAEPQGTARDRLLLLEHDGQAVERSGGLALGVAVCGGGGSSPNVVVIALEEAVDDRLDGVGPCGDGVVGLDGRDLASAERAKHLGRGQVVQVGHGDSRPRDAVNVGGSGRLVNTLDKTVACPSRSPRTSSPRRTHGGRSGSRRCVGAHP